MATKKYSLENKTSEVKLVVELCKLGAEMDYLARTPPINKSSLAIYNLEDGAALMFENKIKENGDLIVDNLFISGSESEIEKIVNNLNPKYKLIEI
ncbi:hypothetical protein KAT80_01015 [Candidatus Pacearchaeota archaeon]|nr:hypothetical protein [Candidatus Pacearchaeota archaeon]